MFGRLNLDAFKHDWIEHAAGISMLIVALVVLGLITYHKRWKWLWTECHGSDLNKCLVLFTGKGTEVQEKQKYWAKGMGFVIVICMKTFKRMKWPN